MCGALSCQELASCSSWSLGITRRVLSSSQASSSSSSPSTPSSLVSLGKLLLLAMLFPDEEEEVLVQALGVCKWVIIGGGAGEEAGVGAGVGKLEVSKVLQYSSSRSSM